MITFSGDEFLGLIWNNSLIIYVLGYGMRQTARLVASQLELNNFVGLLNCINDLCV